MRKGSLVLVISLLAGCHSTPQSEQSVALRLYLGEQYLRLNQLDHAARNFRKVTVLQPKSSQGWWGLAKTTAQQGDTAAASSYYQYAYQMAPENALLRDNYGAFLCALGQYDEARRIVEYDEKRAGKQNSVRGNSSSSCLPPKGQPTSSGSDATTMKDAG
ncbi:hypothetical protein EFZ10_10425 [Tatumella sp. TA1]|nr:hypothetical protein EFZ10_10425 [Tatumella sp. TA1]